MGDSQDLIHQLQYAEFYITNVCNFNCTGCNRFNNYHFKGHQRWADNKDIYRQWAERIQCKQLSILGGEPMANPDYLLYLQGIHELWPNSQVKFLTNGSMLRSNNRNLYNIVHGSNGKIEFRIGLHNIDRKDHMIKVVKDWLVGKVTIQNCKGKIYSNDHISGELWLSCYNAVRDPNWPDCNTPDDFYQLPDQIQKECRSSDLAPERFAIPSLMEQSRSTVILTDSNDVSVTITNEDYFHQGAIKKTETGYTLHNSDPQLAHHLCHSKSCHHFENGKLHKCGPSSLFAQFDQQYNLELSSEDRELIYSYRAAEVDWSNQDLARFISDLQHPIELCKFCPDSYLFNKIKAGAGKIIARS